MKVYATGMNPADCGALKRRPRVALFQAVTPMMDVLRDTSYLVWKETRVGDEIDNDVDAILVSVMLPRSLNCPYALGAMWAISEAIRREIPLVLYMTDWAFSYTHREFASIAKAGQEYFYKTIGGFPQYAESPDMIHQYGHRLLEVCEQYANPASPLWANAQVLIPKYTNWGDVQVVQRMLPGANPVHILDPTPAFVKYLDEAKRQPILWEMCDRARQWILPSLLKNYEWVDQQRLTWPVERFGPKKMLVLESERAVQMEYRRNMGAVCPPYNHEGSGWWRSRWIHSARAKSILLCGAVDDLAAGEAYQFTGQEYEAADFAGLTKYAADQQETMYGLLQWHQDYFVEQVYAPFKKAGL